jgi:mono/diheme cytochrome c family protein
VIPDDTSSGGLSLRSRLVIGAATLALVMAGLSAQTSGAAASLPNASPAQDDLAAGAAVYSENCATCHQPGGVGVPGAFPPLAGNPNAADAEYVEDVVRNGLSGPIEVLGVTYDGEMDPFEGELSDDDIAAVVAYVGTLADSGATETTAPAAAEPGDVGEGRDLFVGSDRFAEGGAACASCHTAGDVGNLGGWSLGPDLDTAHDTLGGDAGLTAWLSNPASETMQPIFDDKPLTEEELADVVAFLGDAPNQSKPAGSPDVLILAGLAGLIVLIGGMAIAWRGMRQTYVDKLRSNR